MRKKQSSSEGQEKIRIKKATEVDLMLITSPLPQQRDDLYEQLISEWPLNRDYQFQGREQNQFPQEIEPIFEHFSSPFSNQQEPIELSATGKKISSSNPELSTISRQFLLPNRVTSCNCEKSHCQKKYCDCFKSGQFCSTDCNCANCCNREPTEKHQKSERKLKMSAGEQKTNQSIIKCRCQKSRCVKNYCECFSLGTSCSGACQCISCANSVSVSKWSDQLQSYDY